MLRIFSRKKTDFLKTFLKKNYAKLEKDNIGIKNSENITEHQNFNFKKLIDQLQIVSWVIESDDRKITFSSGDLASFFEVMTATGYEEPFFGFKISFRKIGKKSFIHMNN